VDGECTGRSKLRWQAAKGLYTEICPARLVAGITAAYNLWSTSKNFASLPRAGGYMQQPARWMKILSLMESESNAKVETESSDFDQALRS